MHVDHPDTASRFLARLGRTLVVGLGLAVLLAGCSGDDADAGGESPATAKASARSSAESDTGATGTLKALYESATGGSDDGASEQLDDSIVRCRLPSGHQYLRRYDCDLRGGTVAS